MNKTWLRIALFALITMGPIGSVWAQARCLSQMSSAKSSCCCPAGGQKNKCAMPAKKTDECPMVKETKGPSAVLPSVIISPAIVVVSYGTIETAQAAKPHTPFEKADFVFPSFHIRYLERIVPSFRAPPAV